MANESLVFDILARDGASRSMENIARASTEASGTLQELSDKLKEVSGRTEATVGLEGNKEMQAQLDALLAKVETLNKRLKSGRLDIAGVARARADIAGLDLSVDRLNEKLKKASGGGFFSKLKDGLLSVPNAFGFNFGNAAPAGAQGASSASSSFGGFGGLAIAGAIAAALPLLPALAGGGVGASLGLGSIFAVDKLHPKFFTGLTDGLGDAMKKAFSGLGPEIKPIISQLTGFVKQLGGPLHDLAKASIPDLGAFLKALEPSLKQMIPLFTQLSKAALPIIGSLGRSFGLLAVDAVKMLIKLEPAFRTSARLFADLASITGNALKDIGSFIAGFTRDVGQALNVIDALFHGKWAAANKDLDNIARIAWHQLLGIVQSVGRDVLSAFGLTISKFNNIASHWAANIKSFFQRIPGDIRGVFNGLPGQMVSIGRNIISGLISGLKSIPVVGTIAGIAQKIADFFPQSPAKTGPLSGRGDPTLMGRRIGQQLAAGLAGAKSSVQKAAESLAKSVANSTFSGFNIAGITAPPGKTLNADIIRGDIRGEVAKIRKFTADIRKLARKGLDEHFLRQLIQAGPIQGAAVAEALADAPVWEIHSINSAERQLAAESGTFGGASGVALYGHRGRSGGGGRAYTINVHVPVSANQADVGRSIVNAIRAFERGSGKSWRAA